MFVINYDYITNIAIYAIYAFWCFFMATNQFYYFSIVLYKYPTSDLLCLLGVEQYAFIEHQYDVHSQDDFYKYLEKHNGELPKWNVGDIKDVHFHLFIKIHKKKTLGGIFEILNKWCENCSQPHLIINLDNPPKFIRYLTHIDDPNKYQYNFADIITNMDLEPYFNLIQSDLLFTKKVIELINNNELTDFKQVVYFSIINYKLELVMKRAYFFKSLL